MSKKSARRAALQLVYENLYGGEGGDDTLFGLVEYPSDDEDLGFVSLLADGVKAQATELDSIIASYSQKRALNRIPGLLRAVLRLAMYEWLYIKETPDAVIMDEANELVKRFAMPEDVKFVNGVLGAFAKDHQR